jgi:uncharacterized membrane protein YedE/YeeE
MKFNKGFLAFLVGFIFALGLGFSGMTQPEKVVGFLDLFGSWDPSLAFVMIGAIGVHAVFYRLIRRRKSPILSTEWHIPGKRDITPALIVGSLLFGMGWGLAGYCPGPAVVSLASFELKPLVFIIFMILGMLLFRSLDRRMKIRK